MTPVMICSLRIYLTFFSTSVALVVCLMVLNRRKSGYCYTVATVIVPACPCPLRSMISPLRRRFLPNIRARLQLKRTGIGQTLSSCPVCAVHYHSNRLNKVVVFSGKYTTRRPTNTFACTSTPRALGCNQLWTSMDAGVNSDKHNICKRRKLRYGL